VSEELFTLSSEKKSVYLSPPVQTIRRADNFADFGIRALGRYSMTELTFPRAPKILNFSYPRNTPPCINHQEDLKTVKNHRYEPLIVAVAVA